MLSTAQQTAKRNKRGKRIKERGNIKRRGLDGTGPGGEATPLSHACTHTHRACMSLMSERRVNPCWRLITQCNSQGDFFFSFSLLSCLADTHLPRGRLTLHVLPPKKLANLLTITGPILTASIYVLK